jgi:hypothetical protein
MKTIDAGNGKVIEIVTPNEIVPFVFGWIVPEGTIYASRESHLGQHFSDHMSLARAILSVMSIYTQFNVPAEAEISYVLNEPGWIRFHAMASDRTFIAQGHNSNTEKVIRKVLEDSKYPWTQLAIDLPDGKHWRGDADMFIKFGSSARHHKYLGRIVPRR